MPFFEIVVAHSAKGRIIGQNGGIPWDLKEDLKHFRERTMGGVLVMGRKTWESLPRRPLPGRRHIVLSTSSTFCQRLASEYSPENVRTASTFEEALSLPLAGPWYVVGGESLYREALRSLWCSGIYETVVDWTPEKTDDTTVCFPEIPEDRFYRDREDEDGRDEDGRDEDGRDEDRRDEDRRLSYRRYYWKAKTPVVWWAGTACYEYDWIQWTLRHVPHYDTTDTTILYPGALLVLQQLRWPDRQAYLKRYDTQGVPYTLMHCSDEYLDDDYASYASPMCQRVIRHYLHPLLLRHPNVITTGLGFRDQYVFKPTPKSLQWFFAGYLKKSDRTLICDLFRGFQPYRVFETQGFNVGILPAPAYAQWMATAKFVLCPVGNCNLDTFRLYEALEAGAIPITLKTNVNQPFIRYLEDYWTALFGETVPFIAQNTWEENAAIVKSMIANPDAYETCRAACAMFWTRYKERVSITVREALARALPGA